MTARGPCSTCGKECGMHAEGKWMCDEHWDEEAVRRHFESSGFVPPKRPNPKKIKRRDTDLDVPYWEQVQ